MAHNRYNHNENRVFYGKIGIFPFIEMVEAKRSSKNRPRGTLEPKCINVTAETYQKMLREKVIPEIKRKCPGLKTNPTYIQYDNAGAHNSAFTQETKDALISDGWNLQMRNQPGRSPDLNINDLGFFNALQSLQNKCEFRNIEEMITKVEKNNFLTLMAVTECIMLCGGDNT